MGLFIAESTANLFANEIDFVLILYFDLLSHYALVYEWCLQLLQQGGKRRMSRVKAPSNEVLTSSHQ